MYVHVEVGGQKKSKTSKSDLAMIRLISNKCGLDLLYRLVSSINRVPIRHSQNQHLIFEIGVSKYASYSTFASDAKTHTVLSTLQNARVSTKEKITNGWI